MVRRWTVPIAYLAALASGQVPSPAPDERSGDLVIGFNNECTGVGYRQCAVFYAAILAYEQGKVFPFQSDKDGAEISVARRPSIGYTLQDNMATAGEGVVASINNWVKRSPPVNVQTGHSYSSVTIPLSQLGHTLKQTIVGYQATNAKLSNKNEHGYFMRTCPPDSLQSVCLASVMASWKVPAMIVGYSAEPYAEGLYVALRDSVAGEYAKVGLDAPELVAFGFEYQPDRNNLNRGLWEPKMRQMKELRQRWILWCSNGFTWEDFAVSIVNTQLNTPDRQHLGIESIAAADWTAAQWSDWVGMLGTQPISRGSMWPAWEAHWKSLRVEEFPSFFTNHSEVQRRAADPTKMGLVQSDLDDAVSSMFDSFLVDAMFSIFYAAERVHYNQGVAWTDVRQDALRDDLVANTDFPGASGPMSFDKVTYDRQAGYEIWNVHPGGSLAVTGTWNKGLLTPSTSTRLVYTNGLDAPLPFQKEGCPRGQRLMGDSCAPCAAGTYNPEDGNVKNTCLPCAPGYIASAEGATQCTPCATGMFQAMGNQTTCDLCPAGSAAKEPGSAACEPCGVGHASEEGAAQCAACARGTYASSQGQAACTACPAGFDTEFEGAAEVAACSCPEATIFVPLPRAEAAPTDGSPAGTCEACSEDIRKGMYCMGGRMCDGIPDRTVVSSFPCTGDADVQCVASPEECEQRCVVLVQEAARVCNSFKYQALCSGWAIRTGGDITMERVEGTGVGMHNVAVLGAVAAEGTEARATELGKAEAGWTLYPRRSLCAPLSATDPDFNSTKPRALRSSFQSPPLAKSGYYLPDLRSAAAAGLWQATDASESPEPALPGLRAWSRQSFRLSMPAGTSGQQTEAAPLFKCSDEILCPGGPVGACWPGSEGLQCAQCTTNFFTAPSGCVPCAGGSDAAVGLFVVIVLVLLAGFAALYRVTRSRIGAKLSGKLATGMAVGLTFNGLQTFGVLSLMAIEIGEPLRSLLSALQIVMFDLDSLQWECIQPVDPLTKFASRLLAPPLVVAAFGLLFVTSRLLGRLVPALDGGMRLPHTLNCIGTVLQVLFISVCMGVIVPFKCVTHPLGDIATLVDLGQQVCHVGDHTTMFGLAVAFTILYPVAALAATMYVIYILPSRSAANPDFLMYFKFLVNRFRFDRYYFGICFLLRNLLIAIVPVLNPNNPILQSSVLATVLIVALSLQAALWPWASTFINWLDLISLMSMVIVTVLLTGYIDPTTVDRPGIALGATLVVAFTFFVMFAMLVHGLIGAMAESFAASGRCMGIVQLSKKLSGGDKQQEQAGAAMTDLVTTMTKWKPRHIRGLVNELPSYDQSAVLRAAQVMLSAIQSGDSNTQTQSRSFRISVTQYAKRRSMDGADVVATVTPQQPQLEEEVKAAMQDIEC